MLFHHDVVAHGEPEPGTFTSRLCRKKRVENLLADIERDARTIVADADFDPVAEISCCGPQLRLKAIAGSLGALGCSVKSGSRGLPCRGRNHAFVAAARYI